MTQISFQRFMILISTDVLRQIRRDIAENLGKRGLPGSPKTGKLRLLRGLKDANSEPRKRY
jgi:hypothetical protein